MPGLVRVNEIEVVTKQLRSFLTGTKDHSKLKFYMSFRIKA